MQKLQVSGTRPCGHLPVVGSTRIKASRCFIVSGLRTLGCAGDAAAAGAAGFAAFFGAAFFADAFFGAAFFAAFAFFAGFDFAFFFAAISRPRRDYTVNGVTRSTGPARDS